jgi:hypothetical protein
MGLRMVEERSRGAARLAYEMVCEGTERLAELAMEISLYCEVQSLDEAWAREKYDPEAGWRPMWPALPSSEQWAGRRGRTDGKQVYMYLYWSFGDGPKGRGGRPSRKTYIGSDPLKQDLAREMADNRRRWMELRRAHDTLERMLGQVVQQMEGAAGLAERAVRDAKR